MFCHKHVKKGDYTVEENVNQQTRKIRDVLEEKDDQVNKKRHKEVF